MKNQYKTEIVKKLEAIINLSDKTDGVKYFVLIGLLASYPQVLIDYAKYVFIHIQEKETTINELRILVNEYAGLLIAPELFKGENKQFHLKKIKQFNKEYPQYGIHIGNENE